MKARRNSRSTPSKLRQVRWMIANAPNTANPHAETEGMPSDSPNVSKNPYIIRNKSRHMNNWCPNGRYDEGCVKAASWGDADVLNQLNKASESPRARNKTRMIIAEWTASQNDEYPDGRIRLTVVDKNSAATTRMNSFDPSARHMSKPTKTVHTPRETASMHAPRTSIKDEGIASAITIKEAPATTPPIERPIK